MLGTAPVELNRPYPFPRWHEGLLIAIEDAVRAAWEHLKDDVGKVITVRTGIENEVTSELLDMLENIRLAGTLSPFDDLTIGKVHRGSEYTNYNKAALQKQPDIAIDMISARYGLEDSLHDAYFIECKLLENNRHAGLYITHGIIRFSNGNYAWAMPNAMMIGYVRNNAELAGSLLNAYAHYDAMNNTALVDDQIVPSPNSQRRYPDSPAFISVHDRDWMHPECGDPDSIELTHLWLSCI